MFCRKVLGLVVLFVGIEIILSAPVIQPQETTLKNTESPILTTPSNKVEDKDDAEDYLRKFGYLNRKRGISKNGYKVDDEVREGIKKLQKWLNLNVTGELDNETLTIMNSPRCHLPDITNDPKDIQKRYALVARWRRNRLTYKSSNYPPRSNGFSGNQAIDKAIEDSILIWTAIANLNVVSGGNGRTDINIGFYSYDHGDQDSFDGSGGVLAHAFYPESGELHFDGSEMWSFSNQGPNLYQVSTHEMGHIFGLGHSNVKDAVMFPYYKFKNYFRLDQDDIDGIIRLYGQRQGTVGGNGDNGDNGGGSSSYRTTLRTTTTKKKKVPTATLR